MNEVGWFIFCNNLEEHMVVMSGEDHACDNECEMQEMDKYPKE